jgi:Cu(I)-responsive transcriptional regulator
VSGLRIGALARATGTKVETIRWYEKVGLLGQPERSGGNYRIYGGGGLARLSFIRRARDLGFSIDQIRALLDLSDDRSRDCATVDAIANQHLRAVDQKIADLNALRRELARVVSSCAGGTVAECRILDALAPA